MQIKKQACGAYATNCYILNIDDKDYIIDPGENALSFIKKEAKNPVAILNTHGHFDHVWDNESVKQEFKIPIYIHEKDEFMLKDPFNTGHKKSQADILIKDENEIDIQGIKFKFLFFPGHTPGCCMIELVGENLAFSGDFLFRSSIGRYDFAYSDASLMKDSLERVLEYEKNLRLLPGHGDETSLFNEHRTIKYYLRAI
ncbi:MBL fold metallo-hydrolase [uncultured Campylobacter sp.]|uniref:MBL fold metallo-hydrolase n=1 Tax=uncultured Campylobacter sp. TaxID=218934 RepID=UPI00261F8FED|nr:MBL fold metallo-hydrolase [uncultured Campylobacter sp.]